MRIVLPYLGRSYGLRSSSAVPSVAASKLLTETDKLKFSSADEALAWLRRLDAGIHALNELRVLLAWEGDDVYGMDPDDLLNMAAARLQYGHLQAFVLKPGLGAGFDLHLAAMSAEEFVTPSTMRDPPPPSSAAPAKAAAADHVYEDTQVAALLAAAQSGVPFCEECAKAAAAKAAAAKGQPATV